MRDLFEISCQINLSTTPIQVELSNDDYLFDEVDNEFLNCDPSMSKLIQEISADAITLNNDEDELDDKENDKQKKKHACLFCGKLYSRPWDHLRTRHERESVVARAVSYPRSSSGKITFSH